MKRSCLFLCLFIFLISCLCVNAQSSIAWVQLGEPQQTHNLSFLVKEDPNDEPYSVLTTKDGVVCRYIPSNYKSATDWSMLPTDAYFVTTSADGLWCSSDFYMRLAGAATELLKRKRALTTSVPITYSMGPVYYRNSFEQRTTSYSYTNNVASKSGTFPLDPCFYKPEELSAVKVRSVSCKLDTDKSRSGLYSAHLQGKSSNSASLYIYCFSKQVTLISEALKVSAYSLMSRESDKLNIRVRLDDGTILQSVADL